MSYLDQFEGQCNKNNESHNKINERFKWIKQV